MSDTEGQSSKADDPYPDVPDWEDEYVDRVSDRVMFNYDLEKDYRVEGESFDLFGEMEMESYKQFLHPSITYGHHESSEYLFVRRSDTPTVAEIERLVELGHTLAEEWITPSEKHYSTEFVFGLVVPEVTDELQAAVTGLDERTMLKYGFHGHYEIHVVVVAPDREEISASPDVDLVDAFRVWGDIEPDRGLFVRLKQRLLS